jgi:hypothetical protein
MPSKVRWHSRFRDDDPHTVNRVGADLDRVALQQDLGRLHDCNLLQKCAHTEFSEKNALLPITQNAHGLLSGQPVTTDVDLWVKATADAAATVAIGFAQRIDVNRFRVIMSGLVHASDDEWKSLTADGAPLVAGTTYYLTDTGKISATPGTVRQKLIRAISRERAVIVIGMPEQASPGDVVGPASATDNAYARYNLTTGKLIQNSLVTEADNGTMTTLGRVMRINRRTSEYTVLATDHHIVGDPTTASFSVNLPAATGTGRELIVSNAAGSGNTVTVEPDGSEVIDADSNVILSDWASITIHDIATGIWKII